MKVPVPLVDLVPLEVDEGTLGMKANPQKVKICRISAHYFWTFTDFLGVV